MDRFGYFDCHADTLTEIPEESGESLVRNERDLDLERIGKFSDAYTQIFAIWKDAGEIAPGEETAAFRKLYRRAEELLKGAEDRIGLARSAADMDALHRAGKAAAFLSIEDLSIAGDDAERIRDLGIRFVIPTWNYQNRYACGAVFDQSKGLTAEGREMIRFLLDQGEVLDVSHLSDAGVEELFELTDRPVMASHSNVRTVCGHPRNLLPEHMREIIRRGGVIGINLFAPFVGDAPVMEDVLRHMDVILEAGGEEALAMGADFDGSDGLFPKGIRGAESVPDLRAYLGEHGFGKALLDRIFSGNAEAFVRRNL